MFIFLEDSQYMMTLLQSCREWRPTRGEKLILKIPFEDEGLCPGMKPKFGHIYKKMNLANF